MDGVTGEVRSAVGRSGWTSSTTKQYGGSEMTIHDVEQWFMQVDAWRKNVESARSQRDYAAIRRHINNSPRVYIGDALGLSCYAKAEYDWWSYIGVDEDENKIVIYIYTEISYDITPSYDHFYQCALETLRPHIGDK